MTLNRTTNDESQLRQTNTGGLNLLSGNATLPYPDADILVNFDVDPSGRLVKRKGTRLLLEYGAEFKVYASRFEVTPRVGFLVAKVGTTLNVYYVYDDVPTLVFSDTVFTTASASKPMDTVLLFDGDTPSVLLLADNTAPIQLFGFYETSANHSSTSYTYDSAEWGDLRNSALAFADGNSVSAVFGPTSVTGLPGGTYDLDIIALRWYWWAESETWYGEDFYQSLIRAGDAPSDQHVQIPNELRTDLDIDGLYPWELFKSDNPSSKYTLDSTGTPSLATEYSFSDGVNYDSETSATPLKPSSLFVTFGRNNFYNKQLILDENLNSTTNRFELDEHGYRTGDEVQFELGDDGVIFEGLAVNTTYYVKKIDDGSFELYSDSALTSLVSLTDRPTKGFDNTNIRQGDSSIVVSSHGFSNGDQVYLGSNTKLPGGLSNVVDYYVESIGTSRLRLYYDRLLRHVVFISNSPKIFLDAADYNTSTYQITVGVTALLDGDRVRLYSNGGTLPTGISDTTSYWVKTTSSTTVELHTTADLTAVKTFSGGSGSTYMIEDLGNHTIRIKTGKVYLRRNAYDNVGISRHRKIRFNGGDGAASTDLLVKVDDTEYTLTTGDKYTGFSSLLVPTVTPSTVLTWIGFQTDVVGLDRTNRVVITNKATTWVGLGGTSTEWSYAQSGGFISIHGFGRFADYGKGLFPTFGTLIQGRLCLSGFSNFPGLLLFSAVSDTKFKDEFFNFYQITNALNEPSLDPFDLSVVSDNQSPITGLTAYQNSLFVFTSTTSYRLRGNNDELSSVSASLFTVAHQGALNSSCVARSENGVVILSATGMYNISLAIEDSFESSELSVKVKPYFERLKDSSYHKLPWVMYDFFSLKFYVGLPENSNLFNEKLLVLDTRTSAWTEYRAYAGFESYSGLVYRDNSTGIQTAITNKVTCVSTITKLNYHLYADYVQLYRDAPQVLGLPPIYETKLTYNNVLVYEFDLYELPFLNYTTYTIKLVPDLTKATIDAANPVAYTRLKGTKFTIQLDSNPGSGLYLVAQKEARVLFVNGTKTNFNESDFLERSDYGDICTTGT